MRTVPPIGLVAVGISLGTVETFMGWPVVGMLHITGMIVLASLIYVARSYGSMAWKMLSGRWSWCLATIALLMPWAHDLIVLRGSSTPAIGAWASVVVTLSLIAVVMHDAARSESAALVMGGTRRLEQSLHRDDGSASASIGAASSFISMEGNEALLKEAEGALAEHGISMDDIEDDRIESAKAPGTTRMGLRTEIVKGLVNAVEDATRGR